VSQNVETKTKADKTSHLQGREARAVTALLAAPTIVEAARQAGVSGRTLRRWLDRPDFQAKVRQAETEAIGQAARLLACRSANAVEVLHEIQNDPTVPPAARVRAAMAILELVMRLREVALIEARLEALERALLELQDAQKSVEPAGGH
jgi:hypothetical protein